VAARRRLERGRQPGQRVAPYDARNRSMAASSACRFTAAHLHGGRVLCNADAMFG
jgi:hypothetical protein